MAVSGPARYPVFAGTGITARQATPRFGNLEDMVDETQLRAWESREPEFERMLFRELKGQEPPAESFSVRYGLKKQGVEGIKIIATGIDNEDFKYIALVFVNGSSQAKTREKIDQLRFDSLHVGLVHLNDGAEGEKISLKGGERTEQDLEKQLVKELTGVDPDKHNSERSVILRSLQEHGIQAAKIIKTGINIDEFNQMALVFVDKEISARDRAKIDKLVFHNLPVSLVSVN